MTRTVVAIILGFLVFGSTGVKAAAALRMGAAAIPERPSAWDVVELYLYYCSGNSIFSPPPTTLTSTAEGFDLLAGAPAIGFAVPGCASEVRALGRLDPRHYRLKMSAGYLDDTEFNTVVENVESAGEYGFDVSPAPTGISGEWTAETGEAISVVNSLAGPTVILFSEPENTTAPVFRSVNSTMVARNRLVAQLISVPGVGHQCAAEIGRRVHSWPSGTLVGDFEYGSSIGLGLFRSDGEGSVRVGSLQATFNDCRTATFVITGEVERTLQAIQLAGIDGLECDG